MHAIKRWIKRLQSTAPNDIQPYLRRLSVPGIKGLELANCFFAAKPLGPTSEIINGDYPAILSELRLLDSPNITGSIAEPQSLNAALGALLTLALDRRVEVINEVPIDIPQLNKRIFMPVAHIIDLEALGPISDNACSTVEEYIRLVIGLNNKDVQVIGAATGVYHAALLIFDRDLSAAYTLLVAGIEILSREYGTATSMWADWEDHESWDSFIVAEQLTTNQAVALRKKLLSNRQIRLRATFRNYTTDRLPAYFWSKDVVDWTYGINANENRWTEASPSKSYHIRDVLTEDRIALSKALGRSYDLRSGIVHSGQDVPFLEQLMIGQAPSGADQPLPFAMLRHILSELIKLELRERSEAVDLPDIKIM